MKKEDIRLTEQDAPLKNTDKAFVKVNRDKTAQPVEEENASAKEGPGNGKDEIKKGTLRHR